MLLKNKSTYFGINKNIFYFVEQQSFFLTFVHHEGVPACYTTHHRIYKVYFIIETKHIVQARVNGASAKIFPRSGVRHTYLW